jgi:hypothetical protein
MLNLVQGNHSIFRTLVDGNLCEAFEVLNFGFLFSLGPCIQLALDPVTASILHTDISSTDHVFRA